MKGTFTGICLAAGVALGIAGLRASDAAGRQAGKSIVGTWTIVARVPGQPLPIGALYTFTSDGALIAARTGAGLTAGQGRWKKLGPRRYAATVLYFRQNPDGTFNGSLKARQSWTMSRDGERIDTEFRNDIYDVDGNVVSVVEGEATATRQKVELLP